MNETFVQADKNPDNSKVVSEAKDRQIGKIYKTGFFVLISLFLLAIGALSSWYYLSQRKIPTPPEFTPATTTTQESPEIQSPSTTATQEKKEVATSPTPTIEEKSDLDQIKEAMATRHGKSLEETIITINKNTGAYASGGVRFEGEMGGGWFLATKKNGKWVIVDDGNGTISCEVIEPWDFPSSIVSECVDELGNPVSR